MSQHLRLRRDVAGSLQLPGRMLSELRRLHHPIFISVKLRQQSKRGTEVKREVKRDGGHGHTVDALPSPNTGSHMHMADLPMRLMVTAW